MSGSISLHISVSSYLGTGSLSEPGAYQLVLSRVGRPVSSRDLPASISGVYILKKGRPLSWPPVIETHHTSTPPTYKHQGSCVRVDWRQLKRLSGSLTLTWNKRNSPGRCRGRMGAELFSKNSQPSPNHTWWLISSSLMYHLSSAQGPSGGGVIITFTVLGEK